jgi:hypothetical protein
MYETHTSHNALRTPQATNNADRCTVCMYVQTMYVAQPHHTWTCGQRQARGIANMSRDVHSLSFRRDIIDLRWMTDVTYCAVIDRAHSQIARQDVIQVSSVKRPVGVASCFIHSRLAAACSCTGRQKLQCAFKQHQQRVAVGYGLFGRGSAVRSGVHTTTDAGTTTTATANATARRTSVSPRHASAWSDGRRRRTWNEVDGRAPAAY